MEVFNVSELIGDTGFTIYGCPVGVESKTWDKYVAWGEGDCESQCYQQVESRLWDLISVGGACLQRAPNEIIQNERVAYRIYSVPRDGVSTEAIETVFFIIKGAVEGEPGLVVCEPDFSDNERY